MADPMDYTMSDMDQNAHSFHHARNSRVISCPAAGYPGGPSINQPPRGISNRASQHYDPVHDATGWHNFSAANNPQNQHPYNSFHAPDQHAWGAPPAFGYPPPPPSVPGYPPPNFAYNRGPESFGSWMQERGNHPAGGLHSFFGAQPMDAPSVYDMPLPDTYIMPQMSLRRGYPNPPTEQQSGPNDGGFPLNHSNNMRPQIHPDSLRPSESQAPSTPSIPQGHQRSNSTATAHQTTANSRRGPSYGESTRSANARSSRGWVHTAINFGPDFGNDYGVAGGFGIDEMLIARGVRLQGFADKEKEVPSAESIASIIKLTMEQAKEALGENMDCTICYNELGVPNPDGLTEHPMKLPKCKHIFGNECIKEWFQERNTCPVCRDVLPTERAARRNRMVEHMRAQQLLHQETRARAGANRPGSSSFSPRGADSQATREFDRFRDPSSDMFVHTHNEYSSDRRRGARRNGIGNRNAQSSAARATRGPPPRTLSSSFSSVASSSSEGSDSSEHRALPEASPAVAIGSAPTITDISGNISRNSIFGISSPDASNAMRSLDTARNNSASRAQYEQNGNPSSGHTRQRYDPVSDDYPRFSSSGSQWRR